MTTTVLTRPATDAKWINASIVIGSTIFIFALAVSAFFAPQWRVLHCLQALIYVVVIVLTRRKSAWGYGAGVLIAVFWNVLVLFRSPVGAEGVRVIEALMRGGQVSQPDIFVQLFAAFGHCLIIVACLVGFLRTRPAGRQWGQFFGGGALAIGYLLTMAFTLGPPEAAENIRRSFGW
jgi:hypothetical protein